MALSRHFYPSAALFVSLASAAQATIVISNAQTQGISCAGGVCAPTTANAVLNVGDLENLLAAGNATVTTTGSGVQAEGIKLDASLTWSGSSTLSLEASKSVLVEKPVTVSGTGGLSVDTRSGRSDGLFLFGQKGHVTFAELSSPLTINGASYTLEGDIASLASAIAANPSGNFALANDYDSSGDGTYQNTPIPLFEGLFDGVGNTISHLAIGVAGKMKVGLFGELEKTGAIAHLRLKNSDIRGDKGSTGAIVGLNMGVLVEDSAVGKVTAKSDVGGLAGYNVGTISYASAAGSVISTTPGSVVGGLVGYNYQGIQQSWSSAAVAGAGISGGLVGAYGNQGRPPFGILNCYATGGVSGQADVGGFAGAGDTGRQIATSYSTGAATGQTDVGGFVGYVGDESEEYSNDYWDTTTSGLDNGTGDQGNIAQITGETTAQLQSGLPSGFDRSIWAENPKINNGLPYLIDNPPPK
jgi:hypothetical protein